MDERSTVLAALGIIVTLAAGCGRLGFADTVVDAGVVDGGVDARPDADLAVVCGAAYQPVAGLSSRYRRGPGTVWAVAERGCEADGGHLIVIDDAAEDDYAISQGVIWLGFSDAVTEGSFLSVTGSPPGFTRYAAAEPNDMNGREDCMELLAAGWNDNTCLLQRVALCECDAVPLPAPAVWCESDLPASCGDCSTACVGAQTCVDQVCL